MFNPIKLTIKSEILPLLLVVASIVSSFYFYNNFPDQVPIHWSFKGEADGFGSAFFAAFIIPILILFIYLLFIFIPYIDPKKDRYYQFAKVYNIFKTLLILFLAVIYFIVGLNGLGYTIPTEILVPGLVGLLLVIIGNYMGEIKSNWFIGIRTPWTLSSERVWNKTHHFGGRIFVLAGILIMLNPLLPVDFHMPLLIATIVIILFGTVVYSYIVYLAEEKKRKKK